MSKDNMTLGELAKEHPDKTYKELTVIQEDLKLKKETGACITACMRRDKDAMDKMKKTKLIPMTEEEEYRNAGITKGEIGRNSPEMKEAKQRIEELQIRLAEALEVDGAHQKQMGKLQTLLTEVEEDNKKLAHQVEDLKMNHVRKAGL